MDVVVCVGDDVFVIYPEEIGKKDTVLVENAAQQRFFLISYFLFFIFYFYLFMSFY